jgi:hypothetical protein
MKFLFFNFDDRTEEETKTTYFMKISFFFLGFLTIPVIFVSLVLDTLINGLVSALLNLIPITPGDIILKGISYFGVYVFLMMLSKHQVIL